MPEQRNLILAIVLSVTIIIAFQYFYELPRIQEAQRQQQRTEQVTERAPDQAKPEALAPAPPGTPAAPEAARAEALATTERVAIENARVEGSLALTGYWSWNRICTQYGIFPGMRQLIKHIGAIFSAALLDLIQIDLPSGAVDHTGHFAPRLYQQQRHPPGNSTLTDLVQILTSQTGTLSCPKTFEQAIQPSVITPRHDFIAVLA